MALRFYVLLFCLTGTVLGQGSADQPESFPSIDVAMQAVRMRYRVATGLELPANLRETTPIRLGLSGATVWQAFEQITRQRPAFRWVERRKVFSLVPRSPDNITALRIKTYSVDNVTLAEASNKINALPEFRSLLRVRGLERRELLAGEPVRIDKRVSIHLTDVTLQEVLSELVAQFEMTQWSVVCYGDSGQYVAINFYRQQSL